MPLHRIYHTQGTFNADEKKELAKRITNVYTAGGLPAFYVVVLFVPIEVEDFFVSGEQNIHNFVRISVQHVARHMGQDVQRKRFFERYENALAPFIKEKGFDWEIQIEEHDMNLWRENGLQPPIPQSKAEKEWIRLNKPVPFDDKDNFVV
ncbi:Tautomerase-3 domain-containing protein [Aphelenchoides bicaudatus]|nr:Tautomerase-3 domain-containing protein [Aphelenchoides bicaudatus]